MNEELSEGPDCRFLCFSVAKRFAWLLLLFAGTGCNTFGNAKLVQELRLENERLLTEYRAEKNRREESEEAIRLMETRLAESEKLLARQYQQPASRLSSLPSSSGLNQGNDLSQSRSSGGLIDEPPLVDEETGLRWQRRVSQN